MVHSDKYLSLIGNQFGTAEGRWTVVITGDKGVAIWIEGYSPTMIMFRTTCFGRPDPWTTIAQFGNKYFTFTTFEGSVSEIRSIPKIPGNIYIVTWIDGYLLSSLWPNRIWKTTCLGCPLPYTTVANLGNKNVTRPQFAEARATEGRCPRVPSCDIGVTTWIDGNSISVICIITTCLDRP